LFAQSSDNAMMLAKNDNLTAQECVAALSAKMNEKLHTKAKRSDDEKGRRRKQSV
jgi:hypothetical protein